MLLERKRRRPAFEDETDSMIRTRCITTQGETTTMDPPRKRIDTCRVNGTANLHFGQISEGSPITPRRQPFKYLFLIFLYLPFAA